MINLPAIFIANMAAIMLMVIILAGLHRTTRHGLFDEKIFYAMATMTLLQCVIETATYCVDGRALAGYHALSYILNSALYIINIIFAFSWTMYADYKLFEDRSRLKKYYPFIAIPAALVVIGAVVNLFTPVFYTISDDNIYARTGLYIIPYALTYMYLLYGVFIIYAYRKRAKKYLFLPAVIFMIPIVIGSLCQYYAYGYSLIWIGVAVAMVSLYINVQNEATAVDGLSGVFTRQYLYSYLQSQWKKIERDNKRKLVGIMIDIDHFKSINDRFGHQVGDKAIASFGRILHEVVESDGIAARYAGDEFVVIRMIKSEADIKETAAKIIRQTEHFNDNGNELYELHLSMGYAVCDHKSDTIDSFLNRMDMMMYDDKKAKIKKV